MSLTWSKRTSFVASPVPRGHRPTSRLIAYHGHIPEEMEWTVTAERVDNIYQINWRLDLANHSPTGLSWGYLGSGPAQCALAILADYLQDDQRALRLYQDFKGKLIARYDKDSTWRLTPEEIDRIIQDIEQQ